MIEAEATSRLNHSDVALADSEAPKRPGGCVEAGNLARQQTPATPALALRAQRVGGSRCANEGSHEKTGSSTIDVTKLFELSAYEYFMLVGQFFTKVEFGERVNDLTNRNYRPETLMKIVGKDLHKGVNNPDTDGQGDFVSDDEYDARGN